MRIVFRALPTNDAPKIVQFSCMEKNATHRTPLVEKMHERSIVTKFSCGSCMISLFHKLKWFVKIL